MKLRLRPALIKWFGVAFFFPAITLAGTLSDTPLSVTTGVPPNVMFALSVEYPTANTAAYQGAGDYSAATTYLGYFDAGKCYTYDWSNGWFAPSAVATNHACAAGTAWSGNFLNWATMTGLDEFRFAMTGGNRYQDTSTLTVLERTYQSGQGGTGNFTNKTITSSTATPSSSALTLVNQGQGTRMAVSASPGISEAVTCTGATWSAGAGFNCSLQATASTNGTQGTTCSSWSGNGSSGSPFACSGFNTFSLGESCSGIAHAAATATVNGKTYYTSYTASGCTVAYQVRVKVCDSSVSRESNCQQFGTTWKPTGVVQENGTLMRFGVMSYFQANDIDNAVLRSKMKYVAPQRYASSGTTIANPYMEWNAGDGTFYRNPANCDAGVSGCTADAATVTSAIGTVSDTGVINYVNKFGSNSHTYKTFDDTGKLYYEALNYLRGLPPTAAFNNGARASNADGFPVITTWDEPQEYACQKNYVIVMGDTHTHCDKRLPGGTYGSSGPSQCNAYTDGNGNAHPADSGSFAEPAAANPTVNVTTETNRVGGWEGMGNIAATTTGSGGAGSYYIAGLAAWAARSDIRQGAGTVAAGTQSVKTFVLDVEENKDCGSQSQYWLAAKYGDPSSYDSNGNWVSTSPWSTNLTLPANACAQRPPTGYNASGGAVTWPRNLLRASDPANMISSVKSALASIASELGSLSGLAQSSGSLNTSTGEYIYQADYTTGIWTGEVSAFSVATNGHVSLTADWKASNKLPGWSARTILTFNDGLNASGAVESLTNSRRGVLFDPTNFAANLSTGQQAALNTNEIGATDTWGADRVKYLRGDSSNETPSGHQWRARTSRLGDVVNSTPVVVAAPPFGLSSDATYVSFAAAKKNRKPMLYVGANDGMLHGFDASFNTADPPTPTSTSGTELVAYVPAAVYPKLSQLMSPTYQHKYYVDGTPVVSEACFSGCSAVANWKTVLVGSLNAGGQGVFALDVTDPTAFSASSVLWEFTDRVDADLGFTLSKPIIRKMNDGNWYVIFGNGYNNTQADGRPSSTGRAYLYLLKVEGPGAGNAWTLNTNYFKIELKSPAETSQPSVPANGLSAVAAIDKNGDGRVDSLYAGDRSGNLWKIDVTGASPGAWHAAFGTSTAPLPLFTADDGGSPAHSQTITTGIDVSRHPDGGFMVLFGTGSWLEISDPVGPFNTDSLYGIWDKDDGSTRVTSRSSLQPQKLLALLDGTGATCAAGTAGCFPIMSNCQPNYTTTLTGTPAPSPLCPSSIIAAANTGQQLGWVMDLSFFDTSLNGAVTKAGERAFSDAPAINGGVASVQTLLPSGDACTGNTKGVNYRLNYLTGGEPPAPIFLIGTTNVIVTTVLPGYPNTSVSVVPAGVFTLGGAIKGGVTFSGTPPANAIAKPAGMPDPPTASCSGSSCPNFIPGWGFLMNMQGATAANRQYVYWCPQNAQGGAIGCQWILKSGQLGRLNWKQIVR